MIKFASPLQIRYFSTTPYLFGDSAVKYSAIPHINIPDTIPDNPPDGYLRLAMIKQLQDGEALFDFAVQFQTDAGVMPIEDPCQEWPESMSPFRKVATIKIPQQEFDSEKQKEFGENLSFSPWHALPEHRPLGGINRARKVVYRAISHFATNTIVCPVRSLVVGRFNVKLKNSVPTHFGKHCRTNLPPQCKNAHRPPQPGGQW